MTSTPAPSALLRSLLTGPDAVYRPQEVLDAAFAELADPADWRGPIDACVKVGAGHPHSCVQPYLHAVAHFTATEAQISLVGGDETSSTWRITSPGYRAGPAGY